MHRMSKNARGDRGKFVHPLAFGLFDLRRGDGQTPAKNTTVQVPCSTKHRIPGKKSREYSFPYIVALVENSSSKDPSFFSVLLTHISTFWQSYEPNDTYLPIWQRCSSAAPIPLALFRETHYRLVRCHSPVTKVVDTFKKLLGILRVLLGEQLFDQGEKILRLFRRVLHFIHEPFMIGIQDTVIGEKQTSRIKDHLVYCMSQQIAHLSPLCIMRIPVMCPDLAIEVLHFLFTLGLRIDWDLDKQCV